jgi:predicted Mrr-cat superfamily restriction endonuclease
MNVWRLIAYHNNEAQKKDAVEWYRKTPRISIGWGLIGDLRKSVPLDAFALTSMIRKQESYTELNNAHLGGPSLWHFYSEMTIGDLVIISDGRHRHMVKRITGDYEWTRDSLPILSSDYYHQRSAETAEEENADDLWERYGPQALGETIRRTLVRCKRKP